MSYSPALPTIAETIWTDATQTLYIRRDQIGADGVLATTWYNAATGIITRPGVGLAPVNASSNLLILQDYFDVVVSAQYNVFTVGQSLLRIITCDLVKNTYTTSWVNMTLGVNVPVQYYPAASSVVQRNLPQARGNINAPAISILSTLAETVIAPAAGSLFTDLRSLVLSNTSSTGVRVDIRDAAPITFTGGTSGSSTTLSVSSTSGIVSPGMLLAGYGVTSGATILPYGSSGTTGTGGIGTYAMSAASTINQSAVAAGSFVPGFAYTIVAAGTTSFTSIGAANNTAGTVFTATGTGTGTGTATPLCFGEGALRLSPMVPAGRTIHLSFTADAKLTQSAPGAAWTAQLSAAVTDVRITAVFNPASF